MGDSESAAEGSTLGTWKFQEYKNKKDEIPKISLFEDTLRFVNLWYNIFKQLNIVGIYIRLSFLCNYSQGWCRGIIKSNAQNWSRKLTESASNYMTPTVFSKVMYTFY